MTRVWAAHRRSVAASQTGDARTGTCASRRVQDAYKGPSSESAGGGVLGVARGGGALWRVAHHAARR